jgi:hypothetical protein
VAGTLAQQSGQDRVLTGAGAVVEDSHHNWISVLAPGSPRTNSTEKRPGVAQNARKRVEGPLSSVEFVH